MDGVCLIRVCSSHNPGIRVSISSRPDPHFVTLSDGVMLTVSVTGNASSLCAPPDYLLGISTAGMPALCQVIMQGVTPSSHACCPHSLTQPENPNTPYVPPVTPQCSASITNSPVNVALSSVSTAFSTSTAPNSPLYANYTFKVGPAFQG